MGRRFGRTLETVRELCQEARAPEETRRARTVRWPRRRMAASAPRAANTSGIDPPCRARTKVAAGGRLWSRQIRPMGRAVLSGNPQWLNLLGAEVRTRALSVQSPQTASEPQAWAVTLMTGSSAGFRSLPAPIGHIARLGARVRSVMMRCLTVATMLNAEQGT